jgi:hypothetical protein
MSFEFVLKPGSLRQVLELLVNKQLYVNMKKVSRKRILPELNSPQLWIILSSNT